ncbi:hypothetical protein [Actinomadura macrotermitis]|uniref:Uncharacterized protein n=1 Tax=Actinomadura macrotermitis TaxID=2585200 RepID=A0A7K0C5M8_9ACTN|nr:hypothetical protein [Actinomadura macrotermitis]MQY08761.1 hypothetical protein [Actinomadura macrotermitis]
MTGTEPLAGFEERRLVELKGYLAAHAGGRRVRRFRAPRRRLVLAAGAVAGVCAAMAVVLQGGAEPAYAVTGDARGVVVITLRDFRDAPALSERLRELGVPAVVDNVPYGKWCREPRGVYVQDVPPGLYSAPANIPGDGSGSGWQMRIDTRLFRPGQTFVWTMSASPDGGSSTSTILMQGPVAACVLVPKPAP